MGQRAAGKINGIYASLFACRQHLVKPSSKKGRTGCIQQYIYSSIYTLQEAEESTVLLTNNASSLYCRHQTLLCPYIPATLQYRHIDHQTTCIEVRLHILHTVHSWWRQRQSTIKTSTPPLSLRVYSCAHPSSTTSASPGWTDPCRAACPPGVTRNTRQPSLRGRRRLLL